MKLRRLSRGGIFLFLCGMLRAAASEPEAWGEIVEEALAAHNRILSGELQFKETRYEAARLSEEEIQREINRQVEYLAKQWGMHSDAGQAGGVDAFFKDDITGAPYYVRESWGENRTETNVIYTFLLKPSQAGNKWGAVKFRATAKNAAKNDPDDQKFDYVPLDYSATLFSDGNETALLYSRKFRKKESVEAVLLPKNGIYQNIDLSDVALDLMFYLSREAIRDVTRDVSVGTVKHLVQITTATPANGKRVIWVDPAKGFAIVRVETRDANNLLLHYSQNEGMEERHGIWWPSRFREVIFKSPRADNAPPASASDIKKEVVREFSGAKFNIEVDESKLPVGFPPYTPITDLRKGPQQRFFAPPAPAQQSSAKP